MIAITRITVTEPSNSGSNRQRAIATTKKETPHMEFSMALPKWFFVSTACQDKHSAMSIKGTIAHAALNVVSAPVIVPSWYRTMAHCAAKQISAMVATDRPTAALDNQVSNKQIR